MRAPNVWFMIASIAAGSAPLGAQSAGERSLAMAVPEQGSTFWQALGDSALDRLVGQALRANLDVQVAEARIRAARAARRGAEADQALSVTAVAGFTRQRIASASFPNASGRFPDQNVWDFGFDAGWELDLFGRIRNTVTGLGAFTDAANHDLRDLQVSLVAEVARTYFELRGTQNRLAVARRNAENQRRTLALVRDRLASGIGSAFDTERAVAQLNTTLASIPPLEAEEMTARSRIAVLIGQPPSTVSLAPQSECEPLSLPAEPELRNTDSLVRRRPDVLAAERRVTGARSLVKADRAALRPRVGLGATVGLAAGGIGGIGDRGSLRYSIGPVVSLPALNRGRLKASVEASRAYEEEVRAHYDHTVLRAQEEVEVSAARYRATRTRVDMIREAALASGRAAELARTRFAEGLADFLQVLDAERTQLEAENELEAARTRAAAAYAALYKAIGGDLETADR